MKYGHDLHKQLTLIIYGSPPTFMSYSRLQVSNYTTFTVQKYENYKLTSQNYPELCVRLRNRIRDKTLKQTQ